MPAENKAIPVRVALRCRPLVAKETAEGCQTCLSFIPGEPQVLIGKDKSFTYDFAFGPQTVQEDVYAKAVAPLVKGIFKGYNATVLAYGQTGSGKTHTMGSGYNSTSEQTEATLGVIPRVIGELYYGIQQRSEYDFTVKASFLEIYNEELKDLLSIKKDMEPLAVRESVNGGIRISGLTEVAVSNPQEMLDCLDRGSDCRTTGATAMNNSSSRSHAIFTITVEQNKKDDADDNCRSKFHLVDLAGSERVKKTHAEGGRFKEGVNINLGLLALGNVISALGDDTQKRSHIPYRDSKLTRLLQDALGGNSHTVMIACVSPADSNMEETLNTLRYADRARKIKNKPIVNRDPQAAEILRLKQLVGQLQMQMVNGGGSVSSGTMDTWSSKIKALENENHILTEELQSSVDQNTGLCEKVIALEMARETLKQKLEEIKKQTGVTIENLNTTVNLDDYPQLKDQIENIKSLQQKITELEEEDPESILEDAEDNEDKESPSPSLPGTPTSNALSAKHALRQAQMGRELQELNKMLMKKQELAQQLQKNDERMNVMKTQYENSTKVLEKELDALQKEKEDLQTTLRQVKTNTNSGKLSEQRRQRLKELEAKLTELRKKMTEQAKIVRLKEQTDKQVTKLNQEIQSMKHQRVKLMKQMKEDSDTFRKWKQEKDKEILQLKSKDRKRQCEMVKMESMHQKQSTVLRRKAEEAAAANKRLKEALSKQKQTIEEKQKDIEKHEMTGIGAKVKNFLSQELEMLVSIKVAEHHLQSQISDRKVLSEELAKLKRQLNQGPPKKKLAWGANRNESESSEEKNELRKQITALEQDIELRNAQITDLQQKLMDADQGDKSKSRWESIHTMVEAKCALKWLLNTAVGSKVRESVKQSEQEDLKTSAEESLEKAEKIEQEMKELIHKQQEETTTMQREHEDKVLFLLRQLRTAQDDAHNTTLEEDARKRLTFQNEEIEKLSRLHNMLQAKETECEHMKRELTMAGYHGSKTPLMPAFGARSPFISPSPFAKPMLKARRPVYDSDDDYHDPNYTPSVDGYTRSDVDDTPVYRPVKRRVLAKRRNTNSASSLNAGDRASGGNKSKRSSSPTNHTCSCKVGDCSKKTCRCRKRGGVCTDDCNCKPNRCINRDANNTNDDSDLTDSTQSTLNTTFNVARCDTPTDTSANNENFDSQSPEKESTRKVSNDMENISDQKKKLKKKGSTSALFDIKSGHNNDNLDVLEGGVKKKRKLLSNRAGNSFFESPLL